MYSRGWLILETAATLAILWLPLALMWSPHHTVLKMELREPTKFPECPRSFGESKTWPARFERYLNDHFGGRSTFVGFDSMLKYPLGASVSPEVAVGRRGWLFLARDNDIFREHKGLVLLSAPRRQEWAAAMLRWQMELEDQGIRFLFVVVPNKSTIYPDLVPPGWESVGPKQVDQLVPELHRQGVNVLDLCPVLAAARATGAHAPYFAFDTHWTDYGSFCGYSAIVARLAAAAPAVRVLAPSEVTFTSREHGGDLARMIGLQGSLREGVVAGSVRTSAVLEAGLSERYSQEGYSVTTRHSAAPRALVFCDSFIASSMHLYLRESFSYSFFIHHSPNLHHWVELVERQQPDIVLYICVERLLPWNIGRALGFGEDGNQQER